MPDFEVKVIDKATGKPMTLTVSANTVIRTQADAERHVLNMPTSQGGKHPGFELAKTADVFPAEQSESAK